MRRARTGTRREPTIALINIVFLMLVFFMVAGTLAQPLDTGLNLVRTADLNGVAPPDTLVIHPDVDLSTHLEDSEGEDPEPVPDDILAEVARLLEAADGNTKKSYQLEAGLAAEALGRYLAGTGKASEAEVIWTHALADFPGEEDCDLLQAAVRASLTDHLAMVEEAGRLKSRLHSAGFSDPRYPLPAIP